MNNQPTLPEVRRRFSDEELNVLSSVLTRSASLSAGAVVLAELDDGQVTSTIDGILVFEGAFSDVIAATECALHASQLRAVGASQPSSVKFADGEFYTTDEEVQAAVAFLREAADYLNRLPAVPVTRDLEERIRVHLAQPHLYLSEQRVFLKRPRYGGMFSPAGLPLVFVEVVDQTATVYIPNTEGRDIPRKIVPHDERRSRLHPSNAQLQHLWTRQELTRRVMKMLLSSEGAELQLV